MTESSRDPHSASDARKLFEAGLSSDVPLGVAQRIRSAFDKHVPDAAELRAPRVLLVGRRGAGKSSLFNAIFGQKLQEVGHVSSQTGATEWKTLQVDGRSIDLLDSRGLQEGTSPEEADSAESAAESIRKSILEKRPDLILFLIKAKEVDSAIEQDLEAIERILKRVDNRKTCDFPIIGVVTQADELDPPDIQDLPTDDEEKNRNIELATEHLRKQMAGRPYLKKQLADVIPTVAYAEYDAEGNIDPTQDARWNIDLLTDAMLSALPENVRLGRTSDQRKTALTIVNACTVVCGAIASTPIPFADMPVLTAIQIGMITAIAKLSGQEVTPKTIGKFAAACGLTSIAALSLREFARNAARIVPFGGSVVSASIAAASTKTIGNAAIGYYFDGMNAAEVRKMLRSLKLRKKNA